MLATLTSKAQITLPKGVRTLLGLEPGDQVDFAPGPDGRIVVSKAAPAATASFASLRGLLPKPSRAFTVEEMNSAVQEVAAARQRTFALPAAKLRAPKLP
jgi:antitoxin PrlF